MQSQLNLLTQNLNEILKNLFIIYKSEKLFFALFFYKKLSEMFYKQYNDVIKSVIPLRNIKL